MKQPLKIVAAGLLLAGIVTGAWLWFGKDNQGSNSENQANNTNQQTTENTNNNPKTEVAQYLVIKEWGVKFQIPAEFLSSMSYSKSKLFEENNTILIFSSKIDVSKSSCGSENREALGIYRIDNRNEQQTTDPKFKTIGNHDYYLSKCEDYGLNDREEEMIQKLAESIVNTLQEE